VEKVIAVAGLTFDVVFLQNQTPAVQIPAVEQK